MIIRAHQSYSGSSVAFKRMLSASSKGRMIRSNQAQCDSEGRDFQQRSGTENYGSDFERQHFLHEPHLLFAIDKWTAAVDIADPLPDNSLTDADSGPSSVRRARAVSLLTDLNSARSGAMMHVVLHIQRTRAIRAYGDPHAST
jgi:hypothetical protein